MLFYRIQPAPEKEKKRKTILNATVKKRSTSGSSGQEGKKRGSLQRQNYARGMERKKRISTAKEKRETRDKSGRNSLRLLEGDKI